MRSLPGSGVPPAPSPELDAALQASLAAGEVALRHLGEQDFELKSDHSIVTRADKECEATIRRVLASLTPGVPVIGEESVEGREVHGLAALDAAWVVDPIDGTASYAVSLPTFGVSIGLLERGSPVLGVFYLPWTDELYAADRSGPGYYGSKPVRGVLTPETIDERAFLGATSDAHHNHEIHFPGKVRSLGSTALQVALVARGAAFGTMLGPAVWDVAGVYPLLDRAGGAFFELVSGKKLDFLEWVKRGGPELDLLACSPASIDVLRRFVKIRK
jgi:myo-inositol-1(or 4)-monophosphatase